MEEKNHNGFNLENLLAQAPSEEIRNQMLIKAAETGLSIKPEYLDRIVPILESQQRYAVLASIYSDKEKPSYNPDKALSFYKKAIELSKFKSYAKSQISSAAVLKEMGRKTGRGLKEVLRFIYSGIIMPTTARKSLEENNDMKGATTFMSALFGLMISSLSAIPIANIRGHSGDNPDVYDFIPLIAFGATNVASGLYEWYHYEKNKLEKKAKGSLEEKVEAIEEPKIELPAQDAITPPVQPIQLIEQPEETLNFSPKRQKLAE